MVSPTRRSMLAASAAAMPLLLSACRGIQVLGTPPPLAPDTRSLSSIIDAERHLIAQYQVTIQQAGAASQRVASELAVLAAEHVQHLAALRVRLVEPAGSSPSPTPSTTMPAPTGDLTAALGALEAAEGAASDRLAAQLLAVPPSLAQLLASIAACEATHIPVLHALRRAR